MGVSTVFAAACDGTPRRHAFGGREARRHDHRSLEMAAGQDPDDAFPAANTASYNGDKTTDTIPRLRWCIYCVELDLDQGARQGCVSDEFEIYFLQAHIWDPGDGVVLTATWLLPVALVPATLELADYQRPGAVDASKDGTPSVESSATSEPTPDKADTARSPEPDAKSPEPAPVKGADADADPKANDSKKSDAETEAEKESLRRRWSTLILGREKSKGGKVDSGGK